MFKQFHKRIYLINRDFQLRYTKIAVIVGLSSTLLTMFLVLLPLFWFRIIRFPNFVPTPFIWAMGIAALVNFVVLALFGVMITHRIAGPMFSLVRQMRIIQNGRWQAQFSVRKTDDLGYLVRNFNDLVDYLVAQASLDRQRLARVRDDLQAARDEGTPPPAPCIAEIDNLVEDMTGRIASRQSSGRGRET